MLRYKQYKFGWFKTSNVEIIDLIKSWLAVSLAFGIAFSGLEFNQTFLYSLLASLVVVGSAFLLHELAHKIVAQKYKYPAEFRAFDKMLVLAIALSFLGFIFAAPGAVMIKARRMSKKKNGLISLAGPATNLVLAFLFLGIFTFILPGAFNWMINSWSVASILIKVNGFIALFNLIPFWMFDGAKIYKWNKLIWGGMVFLALVVTFVL